MLDVEPGKEEEFRYLQRWLAASDRLDRLIEASERSPDTSGPVPEPAPAPVAAVGYPHGIRAGLAVRLARLAVGLHREAAAGAVLRQQLENPR